MKTFLFILLAAASIGRAEVLLTVMADTNGVVVKPANFAAANVAPAVATAVTPTAVSNAINSATLSAKAVGLPLGRANVATNDPAGNPIASFYYQASNPSAYQTALQVTGAVQSVLTTSNLYPTANPLGFQTANQTTGAVKSVLTASNYQARLAGPLTNGQLSQVTLRSNLTVLNRVAVTNETLHKALTISSVFDFDATRTNWVISDGQNAITFLYDGGVQIDANPNDNSGRITLSPVGDFQVGNGLLGVGNGGNGGVSGNWDASSYSGNGSGLDNVNADRLTQKYVQVVDFVDGASTDVVFNSFTFGGSDYIAYVSDGSDFAVMAINKGTSGCRLVVLNSAGASGDNEVEVTFVTF